MKTAAWMIAIGLLVDLAHIVIFSLLYIVICEYFVFL